MEYSGNLLCLACTGVLCMYREGEEGYDTPSLVSRGL